MLVLGLKTLAFEPLLPFVGIFVSLEGDGSPLRAAILDVGVIAVSMLFDFATEILQCLVDLCRCLLIVQVKRLPGGEPELDDFLGLFILTGLSRCRDG